jgi:hypothetical protein
MVTIVQVIAWMRGGDGFTARAVRLGVTIFYTPDMPASQSTKKVWPDPSEDDT